MCKVFNIVYKCSRVVRRPTTFARIRKEDDHRVFSAMGDGSRFNTAAPTRPKGAGLRRVGASSAGGKPRNIGRRVSEAEKHVNMEWYVMSASSGLIR